MEELLIVTTIFRGKVCRHASCYFQTRTDSIIEQINYENFSCLRKEILEKVRYLRLYIQSIFLHNCISHWLSVDLLLIEGGNIMMVFSFCTRRKFNFMQMFEYANCFGRTGIHNVFLIRESLHTEDEYST